MNTKTINTGIQYRKLMSPLALACAAIVTSNTSAQALSVNFTFSNNTPLAVRSVFWNAGDAWAKQFTDDVTVNLFVDYAQLPTDVLAGARPGMKRVTYSQFKTEISKDKSSQDGSKYISNDYDDSRVSSKLQPGASFALKNSWLGGTQKSYGDTVWLTRANAKALSLIDRNNVDYNNFDASIRISNTVPWHYDTNVAAPSGKHDLLSVATHEIGHALGFISGNDAFQLLPVGNDLTTQNLKHVTSMDLLRYSQKSATEKIPAWTTEQTFFSLDVGQNNLGDFSRGVFTDGFQTGHWKNGDSRGIMTPFLNTGVRLPMSELDLRLLDAIGWDRAAQLSKNVVFVMGGINWNTSNPDLSLLNNVLQTHLSIEMEKLRQERDAIQYWDRALWSELKAKADEEFQKRQQGIQETLNKIRIERSNPNKRMEEALKAASDHLLALKALTKVYQDKLQAPLSAQTNHWLNGSSEQLKNNLKNATLLQLRTLAAKVTSAGQPQRNEWEKDIKDALTLLYQEMHGTQTPSEIELNTALAKLLNDSAFDAGLRKATATTFFQIGDTSSSFEKIGEFSFYESAEHEHETASVSEPAWKKGMLGLGLLGIGFLLKRHGKKKGIAD